MLFSHFDQPYLLIDRAGHAQGETGNTIGHPIGNHLPEKVRLLREIKVTSTTRSGNWGIVRILSVKDSIRLSNQPPTKALRVPKLTAISIDISAIRKAT